MSLCIVINGSVVVLVGETIGIKEGLKVIVNCRHLINSMGNRISNHTITWYKDGMLIANESAVNTIITADNRFCIINDTVLASGSKFGSVSNYTCKICNFNPHKHDHFSDSLL